MPGVTRAELVATLQRRRKLHLEERRQREVLYAEQKRILMEDQAAVLARTASLEEEARSLCAELADVRQLIAEEKYTQKIEEDEEFEAHTQMTASLRAMLEEMAAELEASNAANRAAAEEMGAKPFHAGDGKEVGALPVPTPGGDGSSTDGTAVDADGDDDASVTTTTATSTVGRPSKRRASSKLDASSITKSNVWGAILSDSTSTNWIVAGFAPERRRRVVVQAYGDGDVLAGVRGAVRDDKVHFGGFRVSAVESNRGHRGASGVRAKFVYFTWVGPKVAGVLRGSWSAASAVVRARFPGVHIALHLTEREHLREESIQRKLLAILGGRGRGAGAGGTGGDAARIDVGNEHMAALPEWRVSERGDEAARRASSAAGAQGDKETWWQQQQPAQPAGAATAALRASDSVGPRSLYAVERASAAELSVMPRDARSGSGDFVMADGPGPEPGMAGNGQPGQRDVSTAGDDAERSARDCLIQVRAIIYHLARLRWRFPSATPRPIHCPSRSRSYSAAQPLSHPPTHVNTRLRGSRPLPASSLARPARTTFSSTANTTRLAWGMSIAFCTSTLARRTRCGKR